MKDSRNDSVALGANQRSEKQSSRDLAATPQMIPVGDLYEIRGNGDKRKDYES